MSAFRWWRWKVTDGRDLVTSAGGMQAAEFILRASGTRLVPSSHVALSHGTFDLDTGIDDNSTATKWYGRAGGYWLTQDYGSAVSPTAYEWVTGNDAIERDPITWVLEASNDGTWFVNVDTQTSYATTTSRTTTVGPFTITLPSDPGSPTRTGDSWRYIRFTPTARRGGGDSFMQLAEFHALSQGERIVPSTITSTSGATGAQGYDKVNDYSMETKSFQSSLAATQFVLDLGTSQPVSGYVWWTADDDTTRDPTAWTIEGSNNGSTWTTIDTQASPTVPTTYRNQMVGPFTLTPSAPTVAIRQPRRRTYLLGR